MNKWSNDFNACKNCSTIRFPYQGRGYCGRCYPIIKRIENIESWEQDNPKTWKGYPKSSVDLSKDFLKIKKSFVLQLKERLASLKYKEQRLLGPISGIARLAGVDGGLLFFHDAGAFESHLDEDQRLFIYQKLHAIAEAKRWKGIDWWRVFDTK